MANNVFQYGGWNSFTLQCATWLRDHDIEFASWQHPAMWHWLWDVMPLNSPKRPPYWNSNTSGLNFDHITTVDNHVLLHQSAKFYPNRTTLGRKKCRDVDFKTADVRHLGF